MRDRDYYPAGAYSDPYAPYNEVSIPERDFDVLATVTLTHNTTVTTDKYNPEYDEETGRTDADTSDTDFTAIYKDKCFNIPQLLAYLKEYAERDLDNILAQVAMSEKDAELFRKGGLDAEGIATAGKNKFNAMKEAVENGIGQDLGERGTGLWLVNGITTYYQNNADWRSDEIKFDSILHGYTAQKVMSACEAVEAI